MSLIYYLGMITFPVIIFCVVYINWDWFKYFYKFPDDALIAFGILFLILLNAWIIYQASN